MIKLKLNIGDHPGCIKEFKTKIELYRFASGFVAKDVKAYKIWVHSNKEDHRFTNNYGDHTIVVGTVGVVGSIKGWPLEPAK